VPFSGIFDMTKTEELQQVFREQYDNWAEFSSEDLLALVGGGETEYGLDDLERAIVKTYGLDLATAKRVERRQPATLQSLRAAGIRLRLPKRHVRRLPAFRSLAADNFLLRRVIRSAQPSLTLISLIVRPTICFLSAIFSIRASRMRAK
jgi:hypothetical protein